MNLPLLVYLGFGLLVIIARGPFIFWPAETAAFYMEKVFANRTRIRLVAIIFFFLGFAMVMVTTELENWFTFLGMVIGLILLAGSGLLALIPGDMKELIETILGMMSHNLLRGLGALSVMVALAWIYATLYYLYR
jgi:hypothetical protein